jgi:hypothetical protein
LSWRCSARIGRWRAAAEQPPMSDRPNAAPNEPIAVTLDFNEYLWHS